jgi:transcriptional regulator with XRE-family HTH domain
MFATTTLARFSGHAMKQHRLAAGLKFPELAFRAGVTEAAARRWEAGKAEPRANKLAPLAAALGVQVGDLYVVPDETTTAPAPTPLDLAIEKIVAGAPALSDQQVARLRRVFAPATGA